jgi:hypothetical protein
MHNLGSTWQTPSKLLDEALDLEAPPRVAWLERTAEAVSAGAGGGAVRAREPIHPSR